MKAFVTGGTGFIGSHLVDRLIKSDAYSQVRCLVRNNAKWIKGKDFVRIDGDLDDLGTLQKAVEGVDVVFHLAGRVKAPSFDELAHANVHSTENLLRITQKAEIPKFVALSSLAAVGPSKDDPVTEEQSLEPVSNYGKSKKQMEEKIAEIANGETAISILRPPAVYGPREDQIYSFFKMMDKRICPIIGDGKRPRVSMVYVGDVINGILKAAQQNKSGINTYFITGQEVYNWSQIRGTASHILGKKTIPVHLKPSFVKSLAGTVENIASYFGIYPVLNRDKAKELVLEWTCSGAKAKKELGFEPEFSLAEGISRTIHWYQKHHWL